MAYGAVTLVVLIAAPYGLIGAIERLRARFLPEPIEAPPPMQPLNLAVDTEHRDHRPLLDIDNISKSFGGVRALEGVSLKLGRGEVVGLIGPNGSGKTTLVNIISGLYEPDRGQLSFNDTAITRRPPHVISRLGVARTFQHINLADELTALDNIALGRTTRERASLWRSILTLGLDPRLQRARCTAVGAAELLGIADLAMSPCGALPYGTRRRVEVARALATEPELLLLDEPAAGLNEEEQRDLAQRVRRIADQGVTVLVIEHNLVFLRSLAERLICLDHVPCFTILPQALKPSLGEMGGLHDVQNLQCGIARWIELLVYGALLFIYVPRLLVSSYYPKTLFAPPFWIWRAGWF